MPLHTLDVAPLLPCLIALMCFGCGSDEGSRPSASMATVSGLAAPFINAVTERIADATVSVLEMPEKTMVTGVDGAFEFEVPVGSEVTLIMDHPDYPLIQTGTHVVPDGGIGDLTFQAPSRAVYDGLAAIVAVTPDAAACQMVTTVTRRGGTILVAGAHGEANVTVVTEPPIPSSNGPVYFNASVLPDRSLTETSEDGGVLYYNVAPGEYVWHGTKAGAALEDVKMKCRAGVLVNASPPRGMNVL